MNTLLALAFVCLITALGCTTNTVGQVVTNVSLDGRGGVLIDKGTLKRRKYSWVYVTDVWLEDFKTTNVQLANR